MRRFRSLTLAVVLGLSTILAVMPVHRAQAMDRDVRAVLVTGTYGLLGGTALGLVTFPFSQEARTIFIGSSVGLYLGLAVGLYFVFDRDNQDNPLRLRAWDSERDLRLLASVGPMAHFALSAGEAAPLRLDFPVLKF